jgi:hypothetical protein
MQRNYRYTLVAPIGRNFDPEFSPDLKPKEMLALGIFGGKYMSDASSSFLKVGSNVQSFLPKDEIAGSIILGSMQANCRAW